MRARARGALRPDAVLALLVVVQAAGIAWVAGRSWWYRDDFSWMLQAKEGGLTWDVLSRTVFNSFVPLFRAMYAPVVGVGGSAYWPVVVFDVGLGALITWQTWRLVRLWTGPSLLGAVVVGVGATSALWVPTVLWPADALHVLPNVSAGLLAVHGWLRWAVARHGRGDGWLAASVLGYAAALGWGSKGLVVLVVLVLLRVLVLARTPRELARGWWAWLPYLAVTAAYLWQFQTGDYGRGTDLPVNWGDLPRLVGIAWTSTLLPGWLGIGPVASAYDLTQIVVPPNPAWVVVVGQALVLGYVALTIARRPAAWRVWALFAVVFLAHALLLLYGREAQDGIIIARRFRYLVDVVPYLSLAVVAAWRPSRLVEGHPLGTPARTLRLPQASWLAPALAAVACVALVIHLVGGARGARNGDRDWPAEVARDYVHHFQATLAAQRGPFHVLDGKVPDAVVDPIFLREGRTSELLSLWSPAGTFAERGPGRTLAVTQDGRLAPAALVTLARGELARATVTPGGRLERRDGAVCAVAVAAGTTSLRFPLDAVPPPADLRLALRYSAPRALTVPVRLKTTNEDSTLRGFDGDGGVDVELPAGTDRTVDSTTQSYADISGVRIDLQPGERLCLRSAAITAPRLVG